MPMPLTLEDALRALGRTDQVLTSAVFPDRVVVVFVAGDKQTWKPELGASVAAEAIQAPPGEPESIETKVKPEPGAPVVDNRPEQRSQSRPRKTRG